MFGASASASASASVSVGDRGSLGQYLLPGMKTKIALLLPVALLAALAWTLVKRPLPVPKTMGSVLPQAASVDAVSFRSI